MSYFSQERKQLQSIIDELDDKDVPAAFVQMEYFKNPLKEFINSITLILNISTDMGNIIKKYLRDEEWERFVKSKFGADYNPYFVKEEFIQAIRNNWWMGEEQQEYDSDTDILLHVLPYSIFDVIKIPTFMQGTDQAYDDVVQSITMNRDLINDLHEIVKKWSEVREIEKDSLEGGE